MARAADPAVVPAGSRQVFYYADTARALALLGGHDAEAVRLLLVAERRAPQHVHTSAEIAETVRALLGRSSRPELRGLGERISPG